MKIKIGEIYDSYRVESSAKVLDIYEYWEGDTYVIYEIVYHEKPEFVGLRKTVPLRDFKLATARYNVSYEDHKSHLNI